MPPITLPSPSSGNHARKNLKSAQEMVDSLNKKQGASGVSYSYVPSNKNDGTGEIWVQRAPSKTNPNEKRTGKEFAPIRIALDSAELEGHHGKHTVLNVRGKMITDEYEYNAMNPNADPNATRLNSKDFIRRTSWDVLEGILEKSIGDVDPDKTRKEFGLRFGYQTDSYGSIGTRMSFRAMRARNDNRLNAIANTVSFRMPGSWDQQDPQSQSAFSRLAENIGRRTGFIGGTSGIIGASGGVRSESSMIPIQDLVGTTNVRQVTHFGYAAARFDPQTGRWSGPIDTGRVTTDRGQTYQGGYAKPANDPGVRTKEVKRASLIERQAYMPDANQPFPTDRFVSGGKERMNEIVVMAREGDNVGAGGSISSRSYLGMRTFEPEVEQEAYLPKGFQLRDAAFLGRARSGELNQSGGAILSDQDLMANGGRVVKVDRVGLAGVQIINGKIRREKTDSTGKPVLDPATNQPVLEDFEAPEFRISFGYDSDTLRMVRDFGLTNKNGTAYTDDDLRKIFSPETINATSGGKWRKGVTKEEKGYHAEFQSITKEIARRIQQQNTGVIVSLDQDQGGSTSGRTSIRWTQRKELNSVGGKGGATKQTTRYSGLSDNPEAGGEVDQYLPFAQQRMARSVIGNRAMERIIYERDRKGNFVHNAPDPAQADEIDSTTGLYKYRVMRSMNGRQMIEAGQRIERIAARERREASRNIAALRQSSAAVAGLSAGNAVRVSTGSGPDQMGTIDQIGKRIETKHSVTKGRKLKTVTSLVDDPDYATVRVQTGNMIPYKDASGNVVIDSGTGKALMVPEERTESFRISNDPRQAQVFRTDRDADIAVQEQRLKRAQGAVRNMNNLGSDKNPFGRWAQNRNRLNAENINSEFLEEYIGPVSTLMSMGEQKTEGLFQQEILAGFFNTTDQRFAASRNVVRSAFGQNDGDDINIWQSSLDANRLNNAMREALKVAPRAFKRGEHPLYQDVNNPNRNDYYEAGLYAPHTGAWDLDDPTQNIGRVSFVRATQGKSPEYTGLGRMTGEMMRMLSAATPQLYQDIANQQEGRAHSLQMLTADLAKTSIALTHEDTLPFAGQEADDQERFEEALEVWQDKLKKSGYSNSTAIDLPALPGESTPYRVAGMNAFIGQERSAIGRAYMNLLEISTRPGEQVSEIKKARYIYESERETFFAQQESVKGAMSLDSGLITGFSRYVSDSSVADNEIVIGDETVSLFAEQASRMSGFTVKKEDVIKSLQEGDGMYGFAPRMPEVTGFVTPFKFRYDSKNKSVPMVSEYFSMLYMGDNDADPLMMMVMGAFRKDAVTGEVRYGSFSQVKDLHDKAPAGYAQALARVQSGTDPAVFADKFDAARNTAEDIVNYKLDNGMYAEIDEQGRSSTARQDRLLAARHAFHAGQPGQEEYHDLVNKTTMEGLLRGESVNGPDGKPVRLKRGSGFAELKINPLEVKTGAIYDRQGREIQKGKSQNIEKDRLEDLAKGAPNTFAGIMTKVAVHTFGAEQMADVINTEANQKKGMGVYTYLMSMSSFFDDKQKDAIRGAVAIEDLNRIDRFASVADRAKNGLGQYAEWSSLSREGILYEYQRAIDFNNADPLMERASKDFFTTDVVEWNKNRSSIVGNAISAFVRNSNMNALTAASLIGQDEDSIRSIYKDIQIYRAGQFSEGGSAEATAASDAYRRITLAAQDAKNSPYMKAMRGRVLINTQNNINTGWYEQNKTVAERRDIQQSYNQFLKNNKTAAGEAERISPLSRMMDTGAALASAARSFMRPILEAQGVDMSDVDSGRIDLPSMFRKMLGGKGIRQMSMKPGPADFKDQTNRSAVNANGIIETPRNGTGQGVNSSYKFSGDKVTSRTQQKITRLLGGNKEPGSSFTSEELAYLPISPSQVTYLADPEGEANQLNKSRGATLEGDSGLSSSGFGLVNQVVSGMFLGEMGEGDGALDYGRGMYKTGLAAFDRGGFLENAVFDEAAALGHDPAQTIGYRAKGHVRSNFFAGTMQGNNLVDAGSISYEPDILVEMKDASGNTTGWQIKDIKTTSSLDYIKEEGMMEDGQLPGGYVTQQLFYTQAINEMAEGVREKVIKNNLFGKAGKKFGEYMLGLADNSITDKNADKYVLDYAKQYKKMHEWFTNNGLTADQAHKKMQSVIATGVEAGGLRFNVTDKNKNITRVNGEIDLQDYDQVFGAESGFAKLRAMSPEDRKALTQKIMKAASGNRLVRTAESLPQAIALTQEANKRWNRDRAELKDELRTGFNPTAGAPASQKQKVEEEFEKIYRTGSYAEARPTGSTPQQLKADKQAQKSHQEWYWDKHIQVVKTISEDLAQKAEAAGYTVDKDRLELLTYSHDLVKAMGGDDKDASVVRSTLEKQLGKMGFSQADIDWTIEAIGHMDAVKPVKDPTTGAMVNPPVPASMSLEAKIVSFADAASHTTNAVAGVPDPAGFFQIFDEKTYPLGNPADKLKSNAAKMEKDKAKMAPLAAVPGILPAGMDVSNGTMVRDAQGHLEVQGDVASYTNTLAGVQQALRKPVQKGLFKKKSPAVSEEKIGRISRELAATLPYLRTADKEGKKGRNFVTASGLVKSEERFSKYGILDVDSSAKLSSITGQTYKTKNEEMEARIDFRKLVGAAARQTKTGNNPGKDPNITDAWYVERSNYVADFMGGVNREQALNKLISTGMINSQDATVFKTNGGTLKSGGTLADAPDVTARQLYQILQGKYGNKGGELMDNGGRALIDPRYMHPTNAGGEDQKKQNSYIGKMRQLLHTILQIPEGREGVIRGQERSGGTAQVVNDKGEVIGSAAESSGKGNTVEGLMNMVRAGQISGVTREDYSNILIPSFAQFNPEQGSTAALQVRTVQNLMQNALSEINPELADRFAKAAATDLPAMMQEAFDSIGTREEYESGAGMSVSYDTARSDFNLAAQSMRTPEMIEFYSGLSDKRTLDYIPPEIGANGEIAFRSEPIVPVSGGAISAAPSAPNINQGAAATGSTTGGASTTGSTGSGAAAGTSSAPAVQSAVDQGTGRIDTSALNGTGITLNAKEREVVEKHNKFLNAKGGKKNKLKLNKTEQALHDKVVKRITAAEKRAAKTNPQTVHSGAPAPTAAPTVPAQTQGSVNAANTIPRQATIGADDELRVDRFNSDSDSIFGYLAKFSESVVNGKAVYSSGPSANEVLQMLQVNNNESRIGMGEVNLIDNLQRVFKSLEAGETVSSTALGDARKQLYSLQDYISRQNGPQWENVKPGLNAEIQRISAILETSGTGNTRIGKRTNQQIGAAAAAVTSAVGVAAKAPKGPSSAPAPAAPSRYAFDDITTSQAEIDSLANRLAILGADPVNTNQVMDSIGKVFFGANGRTSAYEYNQSMTKQDDFNSNVRQSIGFNPSSPDAAVGTQGGWQRAVTGIHAERQKAGEHIALVEKAIETTKKAFTDKGLKFEDDENARNFVGRMNAVLQNLKAANTTGGPIAQVEHELAMGRATFVANNMDKNMQIANTRGIVERELDAKTLAVSAGMSREDFINQETLDRVNNPSHSGAKGPGLTAEQRQAVINDEYANARDQIKRGVPVLTGFFDSLKSFAAEIKKSTEGWVKTLSAEGQSTADKFVKSMKSAADQIDAYADMTPSDKQDAKKAAKTFEDLTKTRGELAKEIQTIESDPTRNTEADKRQVVQAKAALKTIDSIVGPSGEGSLSKTAEKELGKDRVETMLNDAGVDREGLSSGSRAKKSPLFSLLGAHAAYQVFMAAKTGIDPFIQAVAGYDQERLKTDSILSASGLAGTRADTLSGVGAEARASAMFRRGRESSRLGALGSGLEDSGLFNMARDMFDPARGAAIALVPFNDMIDQAAAASRESGGRMARLLEWGQGTQSKYRLASEAARAAGTSVSMGQRAMGALGGLAATFASGPALPIILGGMAVAAVGSAVSHTVAAGQDQEGMALVHEIALRRGGYAAANASPWSNVARIFGNTGYQTGTENDLKTGYGAVSDTYRKAAIAADKIGANRISSGTPSITLQGAKETRAFLEYSALSGDWRQYSKALGIDSGSQQEAQAIAISALGGVTTGEEFEQVNKRLIRAQASGEGAASAMNNFSAMAKAAGFVGVHEGAKRYGTLADMTNVLSDLEKEKLAEYQKEREGVYSFKNIFAKSFAHQIQNPGEALNYGKVAQDIRDQAGSLDERIDQLKYKNKYEDAQAKTYISNYEKTGSGEDLDKAAVQAGLAKEGEVRDRLHAIQDKLALNKRALTSREGELIASSVIGSKLFRQNLVGMNYGQENLDALYARLGPKDSAVIEGDTYSALVPSQKEVAVQIASYAESIRNMRMQAGLPYAETSGVYGEGVKFITDPSGKAIALDRNSVDQNTYEKFQKDQINRLLDQYSLADMNMFKSNKDFLNVMGWDKDRVAQMQPAQKDAAASQTSSSVNASKATATPVPAVTPVPAPRPKGKGSAGVYSLARFSPPQPTPDPAQEFPEFGFVGYDPKFSTQSSNVSSVPYVSQLDNAPRGNDCGIASIAMLTGSVKPELANGETVTEWSDKYNPEQKYTNLGQLQGIAADAGVNLKVDKNASYPYAVIVDNQGLPERNRYIKDGDFGHFIVRLSDTEYHDPLYRDGKGANLSATKEELDAAEQSGKRWSNVVPGRLGFDNASYANTQTDLRATAPTVSAPTATATATSTTETIFPTQTPIPPTATIAATKTSTATSTPTTETILPTETVVPPTATVAATKTAVLPTFTPVSASPTPASTVNAKATDDAFVSKIVATATAEAIATKNAKTKIDLNSLRGIPLDEGMINLAYPSFGEKPGEIPYLLRDPNAPNPTATYVSTLGVVHTPANTATAVSPTNTKVPPTATKVPPTATKASATATKASATATNVPATATVYSSYASPLESPLASPLISSLPSPTPSASPTATVSSANYSSYFPYAASAATAKASSTGYSPYLPSETNQPADSKNQQPQQPEKDEKLSPVEQAVYSEVSQTLARMRLSDVIGGEEQRDYSSFAARLYKKDRNGLPIQDPFVAANIDMRNQISASGGYQILGALGISRNAIDSVMTSPNSAVFMQNLQGFAAGDPSSITRMLRPETMQMMDQITSGQFSKQAQAQGLRPMMDPITGGGLFERTMGGMANPFKPGSFITNQSEITPSAVKAIFDPMRKSLFGNTQAQLNGAGFDHLNKVIAGDVYKYTDPVTGKEVKMGALSGLQMESNAASYRATMASIGIQREQLDYNRERQLAWDFPVAATQNEVATAQMLGGVVHTQWMKDQGIGPLDFSGGTVKIDGMNEAVTYEGGQIGQQKFNLAMSKIETKRGYEQNMARMGWQQADLSREIGRSRIRGDWQRDDFALQAEQMQFGRQKQNYDFAYQAREMGIARQQYREDYGYGKRMREMQFGWQMEDSDVGIRRSTGFERKQLIKSKERETVIFNAETEQNERVNKRQEESFKREEERFSKEIEHYKKSIEFEDEQFKRQQKRFDQQRDWEEEDYTIKASRVSEEAAWAEESYQRQLARLAVEEDLLKKQTLNEEEMKKWRDGQHEEDMKRATRLYELSKKSLDASAGAAAEQKRIADSQVVINQLQADAANAWSKLLNEVNWEKLLREIKEFVDQMEKYGNLKPKESEDKNIPGGGRAFGGKVSAGKSYVIGELGPEILTIGKDGGPYVLPNSAIPKDRSISRPGQGEVIHVHVMMDSNEIATYTAGKANSLATRNRRRAFNG